MELFPREREREREIEIEDVTCIVGDKIDMAGQDTRDDVKTTAIYQEIIAVPYIHVTAATTTGSVAGFQHN